jgi:hypothetical protein
MDKAQIQKSPTAASKQNASPSKTRASKHNSQLHPVTGSSPSQIYSASNNLTPSQFLHLQRTLGNQAVGRILQAKLTISQPDDPYEREADQVADKVMRMPEPETPGEEETQIQTKPLAGQITPLVYRMPEPRVEEEQPPVQAMHDEGAAHDEETTVAAKPLIQRVPLAVREDDDEEKVAPKLETGEDLQPEKEEKPVQAKPATDSFIQRQSREDEEKKEETQPAAPMIHRQMDEEKEEEIQAKLFPGNVFKAPTVHPSIARPISPTIQRLCTECAEEMRQDEGKPGMAQREQARYQLHDDNDEEEQKIQPKGARTPTPHVTPSVAANIHALNHGGSPLPKATRAFFEPRFGVDLSLVRVHTGSQAAETAKSINARAFTVGNNIAFGGGQYAPGSNEGRKLLAHELTHVVQQSGADVASTVISTRKRDLSVQNRTIGSDPDFQNTLPNDRLERKAENIAELSHQDHSSDSISKAPSGTVRRSEWKGLTDNPIVNTIGSGISSVGSGIKAGIKMGKEFIVAQIEKFAPGAIKFFRNIRDYFKNAIGRGSDGLFGGIVSSIREKGIGATLGDLIGTFASGAVQTVGGFTTGSCAAIGKLAEYLIDLHVKLGAAAFANVKKGFRAVGGALDWLWTEYGAPGVEFIKKKLKGVWKDVEKIVGSVWDALKPLREVASDIWDAVTDFLTESKRSYVAWMDWLVVKALDAWEELKVKLKPFMSKVKAAAKVIGIILLLLPPQGVIVVLGGIIYGLYLGAKALWDKWGKKFTHDVRQWWVTSGLPLVQDKLKEFQAKIDSVKASIVGALTQVHDAVMQVLGELGVLSFLASVKEAIDDFSKTIHSLKESVDKKLAEWSAKAKALLAAADPYIQKFKEGLRQTLLFVTLGPLALLDDGVWGTVNKALQFVMNTPCLRELGGLVNAPRILEMGGKARTFMKKAWDLIIHPDPIIEAIKVAFGRMIAKVPGAVKTAVNTLLPRDDSRLVQGVWSYLEPQLTGLLENWWPILKGLFWDILWPWPKLSDEVVSFWNSSKDSINLLFDLEISRAVDKGLEAFRTFNSILGLAYGWFFLASVLIGALIGGIPTGGAGFGAGAAAGAAFAGEAGMALLALAVAAETATIGKALIDYRVLNRHLANEGDREPADEIAFENIANSVFSLTLMGVMIEVGELAVEFLGAVFKWLKGKVKGEVPKGEAPKTGKGEQPKTEGEKAKTEGEQPTPDELKHSNADALNAIDHPENIRPVKDPAFKDEFDVEVDAGNDHMYRHEKQKPSWCRFTAKTCDIDLGPAAEAAAKAAVGKGPSALFKPGATAEEVAAFIEATAKRLGRSPTEIGKFLRLANQMGADAEAVARSIADSMNNGKPISRELRAQLDEMLERLRNPRRKIDRELGMEANKQYVDPITGKVLEPGTPEHRAQRWVEYQQREGLTPEEARTTKPKWDAQYDTAIENQKAGGKAEVEGLSRAGVSKNNTPFADPANPSEAFIPDGIKNKPSKVEYGKPYDFVEVKYWEYLSQTGNVFKMLKYIEKYGGSLELWLRGGNEATELSGPLRREFNRLNRMKPGTVRYRRFTV